MKRLVSIVLLLGLRFLSKVFYRTEVRWLNNPRDKWQDMRLFVFLHHTSLFEPLFVSAFPISVLWDAANRMIIPGADKTLRRPIAGLFFRLLVPGMVEITRKRDYTWDEFLNKMAPQSLIAILPEGRMMRRTGLDVEGKPMSVRGGIVDILEALDSGNMLIAYSGGLHHVQAPGDAYPKLFKTIRMAFEQIPIKDYKASLPANVDFREAVISDLEKRMQAYTPKAKEAL
ncbi:MAG: hypothetical protein KDD51_12625 [Bdellovibrionales bacterium]|nr:hypothetical protein [Bdellovibrionales bacterium]